MEKQLEEREGDEKKAGQRKVSREHQPKKKQGGNVLFGPLTLNCYHVILQLNDFSPNCYSTESAGASWHSRSIRCIRSILKFDLQAAYHLERKESR